MEKFIIYNFYILTTDLNFLIHPPKEVVNGLRWRQLWMIATSRIYRDGVVRVVLADDDGRRKKVMSGE